MNISLSPELERFVRTRVATGQYCSASEVVREALRLLVEVENERRLREVSKRSELEAEVLGNLSQNERRLREISKRKELEAEVRSVPFKQVRKR